MENIAQTFNENSTGNWAYVKRAESFSMEEKNWKKENNPSLLVPMLHEKVCIFTLM